MMDDNKRHDRTATFETMMADDVEIYGAVHSPGEVTVDIGTLVVPKGMLPGEIEELELKDVIRSELRIKGSIHDRGRANVSIDNLLIFDPDTIEALCSDKNNLPAGEAFLKSIHEPESQL